MWLRGAHDRHDEFAQTHGDGAVNEQWPATETLDCVKGQRRGSDVHDLNDVSTLRYNGLDAIGVASNGLPS